LRRVALQLFEKASVVVTDQRVLVVAPGFPWGYELKEIHSRAACAILTGRERKDGSRLLIVRVGKDKLCLFFARSHQQEADDVLNAIRMEPIVSSREIDKGSLEHEFSALSELPDQDED
jgi:hypothetical protein